MSRQQWGHGYHKGLEDGQVKDKSLTGRWFHSFTEGGEINWQGKVLQEVGDGKYLVQLFSFLDGLATEQKVIALDDMTGWTYYSTAEAMRMSYYRHHRYTHDDIIHSENVAELYSKL